MLTRTQKRKNNEANTQPRNLRARHSRIIYDEDEMSTVTKSSELNSPEKYLRVRGYSAESISDILVSKSPHATQYLDNEYDFAKPLSHLEKYLAPSKAPKGEYLKRIKIVLFSVLKDETKIKLLGNLANKNSCIHDLLSSLEHDLPANDAATRAICARILHQEELSSSSTTTEKTLTQKDILLGDVSIPFKDRLFVKVVDKGVTTYRHFSPGIKNLNDIIKLFQNELNAIIEILRKQIAREIKLEVDTKYNAVIMTEVAFTHWNNICKQANKELAQATNPDDYAELLKKNKITIPKSLKSFLDHYGQQEKPIRNTISSETTSTTTTMLTTLDNAVRTRIPLSFVAAPAIESQPQPLQEKPVETVVSAITSLTEQIAAQNKLLTETLSQQQAQLAKTLKEQQEQHELRQAQQSQQFLSMLNEQGNQQAKQQQMFMQMMFQSQMMMMQMMASNTAPGSAMLPGSTMQMPNPGLLTQHSLLSDPQRSGLLTGNSLEPGQITSIAETSGEATNRVGENQLVKRI